MPRFTRKRKKTALNPKERREVRKIIDGESETKFLDDNDSDNNIISSADDAGGLSGAFQIAQGDDQNERIGRSIKVLGVSNKILFTTSVPCILRHIVLMVNQPSFPSDLSTAFGFANILVTSHLPKNTQKYRVLKDKCYKLDPDTYSQMIVKDYHKINKVQKYDGTAVGDQQSFVLKDFYYTNQSSASVLTASSESRTYYKDM